MAHRKRRLDQLKHPFSPHRKPFSSLFFCSCINCLNGRRQKVDDIQEHLLCDGIKRNYTTWIWHGELTDMQSGSQSESFDVEMRDHLEDMIRDLGQESFQ